MTRGGARPRRRVAGALCKQSQRIAPARGAFAVFEVWEAGRHVDRVTAVSEVHGTVRSSQRAFSRNGGYTMHVQLDDGRWVDASRSLANILYDGEPLTLKEYAHASGRKDYLAETFGE